MSSPIIKEAVVDAPASKTWQALTKVDKMKHWYFAIKEFRPEPGFEFEFFGGDETSQYYHFCRVTEAIENKKLCHTWAYPQNFSGESLVCWEFFEEGDKTHVRLTHTGTENFEGRADKNFSRESFEQGWEYIVGTGLKNFVENEGLKMEN